MPWPALLEGPPPDPPLVAAPRQAGGGLDHEPDLAAVVEQLHA